LFSVALTATKMFKNRLLEYSQGNSLPLPLYHTVNEGEDHLPQFKCTVTVNGAQYDSPPGFQQKKLAQNAAAEAAVKDLLKQGLLVQFEVSLNSTQMLKSLWKMLVLFSILRFFWFGIIFCLLS
jgi:hypothetical protein